MAYVSNDLDDRNKTLTVVLYKTSIQFVFSVKIECATKLFIFKNFIFATINFSSGA